MGVNMDIPKTMRAATILAVGGTSLICIYFLYGFRADDHVHQYNEPLIMLDDVQVPEVPSGKLLVRVEASGLCSSDLGAQTGKMSFLTVLPFCGGHECMPLIHLSDSRANNLRLTSWNSCWYSCKSGAWGS